MWQITGSNLVYNIVEQALTGKIDDTVINARAVSGGRAGSKKNGVVNQLLANNPYSAGIKKSAKYPGGTIPIARFKLATHESKPNWIRLLPLSGENLKGRDGFAIHGRGQRGSDGCIVPTDFHNVILLYSLVREREINKKPAVTLTVIALGHMEKFENLRNIA